MQIQLSDLLKVNIKREVLVEKESGIWMLAIWEMGDCYLTGHFPISLEAEVFRRRERGTEQRNQERGLQSSVCAF